MNHVQAVRYLEAENYQLRQELGRLHNTLAERDSHARRIRQAKEDGLLLALWAAAGIPPSRAYARRHNISQPRWEHAMALLRLARVLTGHRRWVTRDAATIEARLERAAQQAIDTPGAYRARHARFRRG
ncbi:MAG: hypothetical protein KJZ93_30580, partial [Caldilineaceae bacterium]|nr:hypothetical protein [Caldilineaceae bacterium]